jgi:hypothetical protein
MKSIVQTRSFRKEQAKHVAAEVTNAQFIFVNQASSQRVLDRRNSLKIKLTEEGAKQGVTN